MAGIKPKSYLSATLAQLRTQGADANIVTQIDPDAASRQGKAWKLEDQVL